MQTGKTWSCPKWNAMDWILAGATNLSQKIYMCQCKDVKSENYWGGPNWWPGWLPVLSATKRLRWPGLLSSPDWGPIQKKCVLFPFPTLFTHFIESKDRESIDTERKAEKARHNTQHRNVSFHATLRTTSHPSIDFFFEYLLFHELPIILASATRESKRRNQEEEYANFTQQTT